jgi:hypothetical protein
MFNSDKLPKFVNGSSGRALPKPDATVAACKVPSPTKMSTPWGQELNATPQKHWHQCLDVAKGDHYPNDEFDQYYEILRELDPKTDERAAFLKGFWTEKGFPDLRIVEAAKTKPAIVVGVLDESGEFENVEGSAPFAPGDILLESPDIKGRMWVIKGATFAKKYQGITTE